MNASVDSQRHCGLTGDGWGDGGGKGDEGSSSSSLTPAEQNRRCRMEGGWEWGGWYERSCVILSIARLACVEKEMTIEREGVGKGEV